MRNQKGFAVIEAILIVIIIAIIGGVVWYVVKQDKDTSEPTNTTIQQPVNEAKDDIALDETIVDITETYKTSYPKTWDAKTFEASSSGLGGPESETLIENSGISIAPENPSIFAGEPNLFYATAYKSSNIQALAESENEQGDLKEIGQINGYDAYRFTVKEDYKDPSVSGDYSLQYVNEKFLVTDGKITVIFSFEVSRNQDGEKFDDSDKLPTVEAIVNSLEIL